MKKNERARYGKNPVTWRQQAAELIDNDTLALPDDTPLPHRIKTVDAARSLAH